MYLSTNRAIGREVRTLSFICSAVVKLRDCQPLAILQTLLKAFLTFLISWLDHLKRHSEWTPRANRLSVMPTVLQTVSRFSLVHTTVLNSCRGESHLVRVTPYPSPGSNIQLRTGSMLIKLPVCLATTKSVL